MYFSNMYKLEDLVKIRKELSGLDDISVSAIQILMLSDIQRRLSKIENILLENKNLKYNDNEPSIFDKLFGGLI